MGGGEGGSRPAQLGCLRQPGGGHTLPLRQQGTVLFRIMREKKLTLFQMQENYNFNIC